MLRAALTGIVVVGVPQLVTLDSTLERVQLNLTKELLVHDRENNTKIWFCFYKSLEVNNIASVDIF